MKTISSQDIRRLFTANGFEYNIQCTTDVGECSLTLISPSGIAYDYTPCSDILIRNKSISNGKHDHIINNLFIKAYKELAKEYNINT